MDTKNLAIIRHSFAQTVFNHKIQEIAAESCRKKAKIIKIINIALVALVMVSIFASISRVEKCWLYFSVFLSFAEIIFLITQLFFNFDEKSNFHSNSAHKFLSLRDQYKMLIADVMGKGIDADDLRVIRSDLQDRYSNICEISPKTEGKNYYKLTQKNLGIGESEGEEFTWFNEEIDRFLPEELRIKSKSHTQESNL
jgi:hypothetical protein